jgi:antitoxin component YwqK of YwqJK toxin-antitoxin module
MRHLLKIFLLLSLTHCAFGQISTDTIYLDSKWEKSNKYDYDYYRVLTKESNDWYDCKDFWKSGEIQMSGQFSSLYPQTREKEFKWYHKNGNVRQIMNFKNNKIIGQVQVFDLNGNFDFEYVILIDSLDNASKMKISLSDFRNYISQKLKYPNTFPLSRATNPYFLLKIPLSRSVKTSL